MGVSPSLAVLVVDDVPANRYALRVLLSDLDLRIVECESGEQALRFALEEDLALALLDVRMPGMDGYELARLLRGRRKTRVLPIVFVTANQHQTEDALRGYEAGAVDYIRKPIEPALLLSKVQTFLRLERQRRDLLQLAARLRHQIEKRHEAETTLRRTNAELEAFAFHAAHDLRSPLRTISMFAAALEEDLSAGDGDEALDMARRLSGAADRLARLVDGVLEFARFDARLRLEDVDLAEVTRAACDDLCHAIERRHAEVRVQELPIVRGDRAQLHRLLLNLLGNALKFVPPDRNPEVRVTARAMGGDTWEIRVADNGCGLDPEDADRVFEPLCRLQCDIEGAGLGLAVCRRIVEAHGGEIHVEAAPGDGATLAFSLPGA